MTVSWKLIAAIVALITLIVIILLIFIFPSMGGETADRVCWMSNYVKGNMLGGAVQCARPGTVVPKIGRFCKAQYIEVDAEDWSSCDPEFKVLSYKDRGEAARKCAAQQIAHLLLRCWRMGGKGEWEPCSWLCFTGEIQVKEHDYEPGELEKEYSIQLKQELGNGYGELAGKLAPLLEKRQIQSSLIDFYQDSIYFSIKICAKDPSDDSLMNELTDRIVSKESNIDKIITPHLTDEYIDNITLKSELIKSLADKYPNTGAVSRELRGKVTAGKESELASRICLSNEKNIELLLKDVVSYSKEDCSSLNKDIIDDLAKIDKAANEIKNIVVQIYTTIESYVETHEKGSEEEIQNIISDLENVTIEISAELPSLTPIDQDYLWDVMKNTSISYENKPYSSEIKKDRIEFLGDYYKFKENSKFEVGYCDPPIEIFSGIVARKICSLGDQRVQVATAGGGAGGQLRGGSPYPKYCRLLPGLIPRAKEACEGVVSGATRYAGSGR